MQLSFQPFLTWVEQQAAAMQAASLAALDFSVGSVLRSLVEANASVALWIQWLIAQVLTLTRASTSSGADLDSWMADFSFVRQSAFAATGLVTFSRNVYASNAAFVPVGAQLKTGDGSQTFAVTALASNPLYSAALGGYTIPPGTRSASLPVASQSVGTGGNVAAGTITLQASAIAGIDTVTNAVAFTNGVDPETDAALRIGFAGYINTRSRATLPAVLYAVSTVNPNLSATVAENANVDGTYNPGHFTLYVDDGTGAPSSSILTAVYQAVDQYRPVTVTFSVQPPTVVGCTVSFAITAAAGYLVPALDAAAALAVTSYIAGLPMGAPLPYSRLAQVIYDSSPGIANVTVLRVNGGTADLGGSPSQVVRLTSAVSAG